MNWDLSIQQVRVALCVASHDPSSYPVGVLLFIYLFAYLLNSISDGAYDSRVGSFLFLCSNLTSGRTLTSSTRHISWTGERCRDASTAKRAHSPMKIAAALTTESSSVTAGLPGLLTHHACAAMESRSPLQTLRTTSLSGFTARCVTFTCALTFHFSHHSFFPQECKQVSSSLGAATKTKHTPLGLDGTITYKLVPYSTDSQGRQIRIHSYLQIKKNLTTTSPTFSMCVFLMQTATPPWTPPSTSSTMHSPQLHTATAVTSWSWFAEEQRMSSPMQPLSTSPMTVLSSIIS